MWKRKRTQKRGEYVEDEKEEGEESVWKRKRRQGMREEYVEEEEEAWNERGEIGREKEYILILDF